MSYHFLERKDPRVDVLFQGLDNMERLVEAMEDTPKSIFHGERFLTDEELSKILRVSRRTLQEYRTLGVVPYYLVQGKALYKESDILKILEDAWKICGGCDMTKRRNCPSWGIRFSVLDFHVACFALFLPFRTVKSSSQSSTIPLNPLAFNTFMSSSTFLSVTCA